MLKTLINIFILVLFLSSCSSGPQAIDYGKENCERCKMAIIDKHFAAELITQKGKFYKFDDVHCLAAFVKADEIKKAAIKSIYLMDYANPGNFILSGAALFIKSERLRSPMDGNIAAFKNADSMKHYLQKLQGVEVRWNQLLP